MKFKLTPKQARKLWIRALRSGKLKQTTTTLAIKASNGQISYCCLGVACKLFAQHETEHKLVRNLLKEGRFQWGNQSRILPEKVRNWLGLTVKSGEFRQDEIIGAWGSLAVQNDEGASFAAIADLIEREPEGLLSVE